MRASPSRLPRNGGTTGVASCATGSRTPSSSTCSTASTTRSSTPAAPRSAPRPSRQEQLEDLAETLRLDEERVVPVRRLDELDRARRRDQFRQLLLLVQGVEP